MKYFTQLRHFLQEQWLLFVLSRSPVTFGLLLALVGAVYAAFHFKVADNYSLNMAVPYGVLAIAVIVFCITTDEDITKVTPLKERARIILRKRGEVVLPGELSSFTASLVCSTWGEKEKSAYESAALETRTLNAKATRKPPRL